MTLEEHNEQQAAIYQDEYEQLLQENIQLKKEKLLLLKCLCGIQKQCLIEITIGFLMDAEGIDKQICDATRLTFQQLVELVGYENEKV